MNPFIFARAHDVQGAVAAYSDAGTKFIGGGTNLIDLMKLDIERPAKLVDINALGLDKIEEINGGVRIGALARNTEIAYHPLIQSRYPVLAQAILSGASPQLRNMATAGGNLMQRTRCPYFYDKAYACNKRKPGSGCDAIKGYNRNNAILGTSEQCIATHPSDMCVALAALGATVHVAGARNDRQIPFGEFHLLPGDHPDTETALQPGELITAIHIPAVPFATRSSYLKVRDRASYDFALASAAVALDIQGGRIREARIAMGGIGTKPWRMKRAEKILEGAAASRASYKDAAEESLKDARGYQHNAFKIALAKNTLINALENTANL